MGKPWERDLMAATAAYPRMDRFVWHQRVTRTATLMVKSATWPQTRVLGRILLRNPVSPREDALGRAYPWSRVLCQRPLSADWSHRRYPCPGCSRHANRTHGPNLDCGTRTTRYVRLLGWKLVKKSILRRAKRAWQSPEGVHRERTDQSRSDD